MTQHSDDVPRVTQLLAGTQDRRTFLRRAVALGVSVPVVASLLAACGEEDDDDEPTPSTGGSADPTPTEAAADDEPTEDEAEDEPTEEEPADEPTEDEGDDEPTEEDSEPDGEGVYGGRMRVVIIGEPPTLDVHHTTAGVVSQITWHMYETLFTYDSDFQVIPMLAESYEVSGDGLNVTVILREGVPFHNGEIMVAADVIASIERWGALSGAGAGLLEVVEEIREVDDHTIEFTLTEPYGIFATALALNWQGCAIHPKSELDEIGQEMAQEGLSGTGPYVLSERQIDAYIRLARFDDYAALPGEANGYGGRKFAYLDEIEFVPVPDSAARTAGLQAGDYHYLTAVSGDDYEILQNSEGVVADKLPPGGWDTVVLNWRSPLMENLKIRQAFQAALNHEEIMQAGRGEGFYRLDPSIMLRETAWATDVGAELYNQNDTEKARQLLEEAGYDGTPIRYLTTQEYLNYYNEAVVAKQHLEAAGFVVELDVVDWATVVERRAKPEEWDVFSTADGFKPDPTQLATMQICNFPGWWCSEDTMALMEDFRSESDFEARFAIWEKIQENFYNEVPFIKFGDSIGILAMSDKVGGFEYLTQLTLPFWNMWLNE